MMRSCEYLSRARWQKNTQFSCVKSKRTHLCSLIGTTIKPRDCPELRKRSTPTYYEILNILLLQAAFVGA